MNEVKVSPRPDGPVLGAQARLLSNQVQAPHLLEQTPFRTQLAPIFPFLPLAGHELCYAGTGPLRPGEAIDFGEPIILDTKLPDCPNRVFRLAEIATQFRIDYRAQDIFSSNVNDQTNVQMELAMRELHYRFWTLFESGNAEASDDTSEFDGLEQIVDPANVVDLSGEALTLEALEQVKELVRANDGCGVIIYTSSVGKRAIHAAHWRRGLEAQYREIPVRTADGGLEVQRRLCFDGAPVMVNDFNQILEWDEHGAGRRLSPYEAYRATASDALVTNVWFLILGRDHLHGLTPAAMTNDMFMRRATLLPDGSTEVHHVTLPAGIALGSAGALAVLRNVGVPCAQ